MHVLTYTCMAVLCGDWLSTPDVFPRVSSPCSLRHGLPLLSEPQGSFCCCFHDVGITRVCLVHTGSGDSTHLQLSALLTELSPQPAWKPSLSIPCARWDPTGRRAVSSLSLLFWTCSPLGFIAPLSAGHRGHIFAVDVETVAQERVKNLPTFAGTLVTSAWTDPCGSKLCSSPEPYVQ